MHEFQAGLVERHDVGNVHRRVDATLTQARQFLRLNLVPEPTALTWLASEGQTIGGRARQDHFAYSTRFADLPGIRSAAEQLAYSLPLIYAGFLVDDLGAPAVYGLAAGICGLGGTVLIAGLRQVGTAEE